ncbi:hypothetical protein [Pedobacter paludis]|uniref:RNA polymerase alpha subunit C-terminal domain-containing protein n=1 Tax=Pedobacter paludis TaxID=2203212 RepID=A0A317EZ47_9SPHI|nr:hypothetical protein [Pedobacter paludis]PWS32250.1 hypothetical protein DF947_10810 [Pedobacter paludis]
MNEDIKNDWVDNQLYISHRFNGWLNKVRKVERVYQLEELTVAELLDAEGMTIPKLKRIIKFMSQNGLNMAMTAAEIGNVNDQQSDNQY